MRAGSTGLRTATVAVVGVAVLAVAALLAAHQPAPRPARTAAVVAQPGGVLGGSTGTAHGTFPWWLVVVALALLVMVGLLLWFVFRDSVAPGSQREVSDDNRLRADEFGRGAADLAALADLALADAAEALAAGHDAREVVVACWVRIEVAAEESGQGRRAAETATDVARRWLVGSPDRAAVDELAALYHLARYSTHPMTGAHRDRARSALRGVLGVAT